MEMEKEKEREKVKAWNQKGMKYDRKKLNLAISLR